MDTLTGIPTPAAARAADPIHLAAQVLQLEQALAAASKGISDRIAGETSTAVQVEPEPRPAEAPTGDVSAVSLERAKFSEVARLEDVLTVAPPDPGARIVPQTAPEPAAATEAPTAEPLYVAAQALREAFWFEQASAYKPHFGVEASFGEAHAPVVPNDLAAAERTTSPAEPRQPESQAPLYVQRDSAAAEPLVDPTARGRWAVSLCILALIALVAMLAGRRR